MRGGNTQGHLLFSNWNKFLLIHKSLMKTSVCCWNCLPTQYLAFTMKKKEVTLKSCSVEGRWSLSSIVWKFSLVTRLRINYTKVLPKQSIQMSVCPLHSSILSLITWVNLRYDELGRCLWYWNEYTLVIQNLKRDMPWSHLMNIVFPQYSYSFLVWIILKFRIHV